MRTLFVCLGLSLVSSPFVAATALAQAPSCTPDARLSEAAAALALEGAAPTEARLMELVRDAGSEAPRAHALSVAEDDDTRLGAWLTRLVERGETPLACGEAHLGDHRVVIAVPAAATLEIHGARVSGRLASGWHDPVLYAEDPSGEVHALALEGPAFETTLPEDLEAVRLQVVARGPDGPRPVAERVLGARDGALGGTSDDPRERVAAVRAAMHAPALRTSRRFDAMARAHAEHVCEAEEAAHELEPGRDPSERLHAEGIEARHVGEVVARGVDLGAALDTLVQSPSHRAALVDRRFTDAGVGTAESADGHRCVVVLLAAWPRVVARRSH